MLFRGVCSKHPFYKKDFFLREDFFETNLDLSKHPEQVFWIFFKFFKYFFLIFVFVWLNGELMELCAKFWNFWIDIHREIICQSWLLLTTFFNFPIVQWLVILQFASILINSSQFQSRFSLLTSQWPDVLAPVNLHPDSPAIHSNLRWWG